MIISVVLSGGSGTRLWPLSSPECPKQFCALGDSLSLFQQALFRGEHCTSGSAVVVGNHDHRFLLAEQLRAIRLAADILLEPVGRNTAAALALAAFRVVDSRLRGNDIEERNDTEEGNDCSDILLVLPADHVIRDEQAFVRAVEMLEPAVRAGKFGVFGVVPTSAATGFGYLDTSSNSGSSGRSDSVGLLSVQQFVEKPPQALAEEFLAHNQHSHSPRYLWNSGMFMVRADRYLDELKRFQPEVFHACRAAVTHAREDLDFIRVDEAAFAASPDISIDYAIMEPLSLASPGEVVAAPLDAGWSDLGSWSAVWDGADKSAEGNAVLTDSCCELGSEPGSESSRANAGGVEGVIFKDSQNTLVVPSDRKVAVLGVSDVVIVDSPDGVLVAHRSRDQQVKQIVTQLNKQGHSEPRVAYRPWGRYEIIDRRAACGDGNTYQIKRLIVNPGASLSLQVHEHRAEHWIVVSGVARVTNGDHTFKVAENESTYIPSGQVHSLENPGNAVLEMIEVQSGSYVGEDDIVRLDDKYGRD